MAVNKIGSNEQRILLQLLKEARIDAGLRQSDLADRLGVPQSRISKYEVGERRIDILEMREVCLILGISLTSFTKKLEQKIDSET